MCHNCRASKRYKRWGLEFCKGCGHQWREYQPPPPPSFGSITGVSSTLMGIALPNILSQQLGGAQVRIYQDELRQQMIVQARLNGISAQYNLSRQQMLMGSQYAALDGMLQGLAGQLGGALGKSIGAATGHTDGHSPDGENLRD